MASSLDDLKIASHKVEDIETLILEQDWKIKHSTIDSHLSLLSYVGMATNGLTLICLCYCCLRCYRRRCPKFQNGGRIIPVTRLFFKTKDCYFNSFIEGKSEVSESRASIKARHSITDAAEAADLVCLNINAKSAMPTGKR